MRAIDPLQSLLLVVDLQQRLMPVIDGAEHIRDNAVALLSAAASLEIDTLATEQLPERLGATVPEVAALLSAQAIAKASFDACRDTPLLQRLGPPRDIVLLGAETHVCVLQSALSLLQHRHKVFVVQDACGSRSPANKNAGLARMAAAGAQLVSTEMVIFEWLQSAEHPKFRQLLQLIK